MRDHLGLDPYDGNFDRLRLSIISMKNRLGLNFKQKIEVTPEPKKPKTSFEDKLNMFTKK